VGTLDYTALCLTYLGKLLGVFGVQESVWGREIKGSQWFNNRNGREGEVVSIKLAHWGRWRVFIGWLRWGFQDGGDYDDWSGIILGLFWSCWSIDGWRLHRSWGFQFLEIKLGDDWLGKKFLKTLVLVLAEEETWTIKKKLDRE
jgi:hypothetical protein